MRVERLGEGDWARARAIRLAALADAPDAFWRTLAEELLLTEADWRGRLAREDATTFVVVDEAGGDVALATGIPQDDHPGDAAVVSVWVAPSARGRGAGRLVMQAVIDWSRVCGYVGLRLDVGDDNAPANALYSSLGFEPTGERFAFPPPREHVNEHERRLVL